jgi:ribosomal protein L3 glutamine methyltransferase
MRMAKRNKSAPQNLREWILWGETQLADAGLYFGHGTENALDESAWLVGSALGLSPHELDAHLSKTLTESEQQAVRQLVEQRISTRKPAAYLLNEAWFAGLRFYVDERVIVPRSITGEYIVERFAPWIEPARVQRILDLCTGSGCMAIACAVAFPEATVDAVDISPDALAVTKLNIERHKLSARVRERKSDLFNALAGERYDVIVTNPPYVGTAEMRGLPREYQHEPKLALHSGADGLDAIKRILAEAIDHLTPDGILIAEVGNSNTALQTAFPDVPFMWLTTDHGDDSVFLLTAAELFAHRKHFRTPRV